MPLHKVTAMRNLFAALYFLLALFGCDGGGTTTITHSAVDGVDVIHARTRVKAGVARFECLASASGMCHYTLLPPPCAGGTPCTEPPVDRFAMKTGESREVVGLPRFDACVSQEASGTDCGMSVQ